MYEVVEVKEGKRIISREVSYIFWVKCNGLGYFSDTCKTEGN